MADALTRRKRYTMQPKLSSWDLFSNRTGWGIWESTAGCEHATPLDHLGKFTEHRPAVMNV